MLQGQWQILAENDTTIASLDQRLQYAPACTRRECGCFGKKETILSFSRGDHGDQTSKQESTDTAVTLKDLSQQAKEQVSKAVGCLSKVCQSVSK